jgi:hypothetical protein
MRQPVRACLTTGDWHGADEGLIEIQTSWSFARDPDQ